MDNIIKIQLIIIQATFYIVRFHFLLEWGQIKILWCSVSSFPLQKSQHNQMQTRDSDSHILGQEAK